MLTALQSLRQTGRSTRMLKDAFRLSQEGRAVYVVAADGRQSLWLEKRARELGCHAPSIKFETFTSLPEFDVYRMKLHGAHPNCVVLVDHYAIEGYFAPLLEMLHRYDEVPA